MGRSVSMLSRHSGLGFSSPTLRHIKHDFGAQWKITVRSVVAVFRRIVYNFFHTVRY
jgi:hypothetical protein